MPADSGAAMPLRANSSAGMPTSASTSTALNTTGTRIGALASAFFVLRRFVTDRASAGIILITGLLSSVYPLTYWMHTEAFFCLLGFNAILIAFRIAEGKARLEWEVPLMLALLGFGAFTRWPGVLHMVLIAPILLSGPRQPWRRLSTQRADDLGHAHQWAHRPEY